MVAASLYTNPAFVGLVLALPSSLLGYLAYRHSQKVDAVAMQAGIATVESGSIGQVIDGLNKNIAGMNQIVTVLQEDNAILREDKVALEKCRQELADLTSRLPRPLPAP